MRGILAGAAPGRGISLNPFHQFFEIVFFSAHPKQKVLNRLNHRKTQWRTETVFLLFFSSSFVTYDSSYSDAFKWNGERKNQRTREISSNLTIPNFFIVFFYQVIYLKVFRLLCLCEGLDRAQAVHDVPGLAEVDLVEGAPDLVLHVFN